VERNIPTVKPVVGNSVSKELQDAVVEKSRMESEWTRRFLKKMNDMSFQILSLII